LETQPQPQPVILPSKKLEGYADFRGKVLIFGKPGHKDHFFTQLKVVFYE